MKKEQIVILFTTERDQKEINDQLSKGWFIKEYMSVYVGKSYEQRTLFVLERTTGVEVE